jgi:hypothetical protein
VLFLSKDTVPFIVYAIPPSVSIQLVDAVFAGGILIFSGATGVSGIVGSCGTGGGIVLVAVVELASAFVVEGVEVDAAAFDELSYVLTGI